MIPNRRYVPIPRRRGYVVATGPGSVLAGNRARYLARIALRRWRANARYQSVRRQNVIRNTLRYGIGSYRRRPY